MSRICKEQLVSRVSDEAKIAKADVKTIIDITMKEIQKCMENNEEVVLKDFGIFKVQTLAAKKGHNINTGKTVDIPERKRVKFIPGKKLTQSVK